MQKDYSYSSLEEKTNDFIKIIDMNHFDPKKDTMGKHGKIPQTNCTDLRVLRPKIDEQIEQQKLHEQIQKKVAKNIEERTKIANLQVSQKVGRIITAGLIVIAAGTFAGTVVRYFEPQIQQGINQLFNSDQDQNPDIYYPDEETVRIMKERQENAELMKAYEEANIVPEADEYGLTPSQIEEKRKADEQANEEARSYLNRTK